MNIAGIIVLTIGIVGAVLSFWSGMLYKRLLDSEIVKGYGRPSLKELNKAMMLFADDKSNSQQIMKCLTVYKISLAFFYSFAVCAIALVAIGIYCQH